MIRMETIKLGRVPDVNRLADEWQGIMERFVNNVLRETATYPPRKYVSIAEAGGWVSDRQRRWFFWALKEGKIEVPYKRTGTLGRSWQQRVARETDSIVGVVGSQGQIAPYNVYVQGPQQSRMMELIGWKKIEDIYKPHWQKAVAEAKAAADRFAK